MTVSIKVFKHLKREVKKYLKKNLLKYLNLKKSNIFRFKKVFTSYVALSKKSVRHWKFFSFYCVV